MRPYACVCFDFDYTLGDSTDAIVAGFRYGLTQLGWPEPDREAVRATIGYLLEDAYTILTGDADEDHRRSFRPLFTQVAQPRQRTESVLFPGGKELLEALYARGVKLGLISTKRSDILEDIMRRYGLLEKLSLVIGSDRVTRHKPDPEGLLLALERLHLRREELLFCGDTALDAGAAQAAGVDFCAVLNGTTPAAAFQDLPHMHISPDLWDLKNWLGV